jgi:agmatine deiminase
VRLVVQSAREREQACRHFEASGVDMGRVDFVTVGTNRSWVRDYAPLFVCAKGAPPAAVKWRFDGWGRYADHPLDDAAGRHIAKGFAARTWRPRALGRPVVLEGGAIDVDGRGTLLTTSECLLTGERARAAHLGQPAVERLLQRYLGVSRVIWLPRGVAGDDTSGHVDDFARFVSPGTVVVASEHNRKDDNYEPLRRAASVLRAAHDAKGRRLEVVSLPMPQPLYYRGERLPASYANFYIANKQVLVPTFNDPNDRIALGILAELFPRRQVVGIHAVELVLGLGTLHCSTMQEPR